MCERVSECVCVCVCVCERVSESECVSECVCVVCFLLAAMKSECLSLLLLGVMIKNRAIRLSTNCSTLSIRFCVGLKHIPWLFTTELWPRFANISIKQLISSECLFL